MPKCQSAKVPKCRSAEVPKCRVPKCRSAEVPKWNGSGAAGCSLVVPLVRPENGDTHLYGKLLSRKGWQKSAKVPKVPKCQSATASGAAGCSLVVPLVRPENGDTHLYGKLLSRKGWQKSAKVPKCQSAKVPKCRSAKVERRPLPTRARYRSARDAAIAYRPPRSRSRLGGDFSSASTQQFQPTARLSALPGFHQLAGVHVV